MIAILVASPNILPWSEISIPILPQLHVVACLAPWIGSTIYHLFMSHQGGYTLYKNLLMLDMLGIWVAQNLGEIFLDFAVRQAQVSPSLLINHVPQISSARTCKY